MKSMNLDGISNCDITNHCNLLRTTGFLLDSKNIDGISNCDITTNCCNLLGTTGFQLTKAE
jgi:hypothetical protein